MSMPEAPMYEYGLPSSRKNHVWDTREITTVQTITIAHPMSQAPNSQFGLGIPVANAAHPFAPLRRGESIDHRIP